MAVVELMPVKQPVAVKTQKIKIRLVVPLSMLTAALANVDHFISSKEGADVSISLNILPG